MGIKRFTFSVEEMTSKLAAEFSAEAAKVDEAFRAGAWALPPIFADAGAGLRMFRIGIQNGKTGEMTGAIGQGDNVAEAWGDILKGARESFRPKQDGKPRPATGFSILLPARKGDLYAVGRCVARSIEDFESDETYQQQRARLMAAPRAA